MKNTQGPGAAQRPHHPATGNAKRRKQPEPVAHVRYMARSLQSTVIAFMAPTVLAPFLPAPLKPWRFVASGLLYADQQQQPSGMRFTPPPRSAGQCLGMMAGLLPFIPAFALQAHLTETWCAKNGTLGNRAAVATQHTWTSFWQRFPKRVADVAVRYPINFVLARCIAQAAASMIGSNLSAGYHRMRGRQLVAHPVPAAKPSLQQRVAARPEVYAAGGLLFLMPTMLETRIGLAMLRKAHVPPTLNGTVITTSLVSAALMTAMVPAQRSS